MIEQIRNLLNSGMGGVVKLICPGRVSSFHLLQGVLDITLCHHILLLINRFLLLIFFLYNNSKITVHRIISGICHFYELSVIKWNSVILCIFNCLMIALLTLMILNCQMLNCIVFLLKFTNKIE
jgi:hypothetical protein